MDAYTSRNSAYFSDANGEIIREHGSEKESWGKLWVYISTKKLEIVAKQKKINLTQKPKPRLEEKVAEDFIRALQDEEMDITELGGRIFALRKGPEGYTQILSGPIIKIGEYEPPIEVVKD